MHGCQNEDTGPSGARRDRAVQESRQDTYKLRGKLKEPTVCPECGALFRKGRWTWGTAPTTAEAASCPACHRTRDKYPKGFMTISRAVSKTSKREGLVISTTDTHLPRRIGEALKHADGRLELRYDNDEDFVGGNMDEMKPATGREGRNLTRRQEGDLLTSRGATGSAIMTRLMIAIVFLAGMGTAQAKIVVPAGSVIEVDEATIKAVVTMFERAEQAIKAHDLETVMGVYASQYNYHGLKKEDIRRVWKDLFDEYGEITNTHLFTKISKAGSGSNTVLEITCTGHLWAVSKTSGLHVPIDSWHEEVHYLGFEEGNWRIRGNVGESPRVLPFGTAPHPLF